MAFGSEKFFTNFERKQIKTVSTQINLVVGGTGEPVLLLHGFPQTHVCWHKVAPKIAESRTVICTDLRGCGDSGNPEPDDRFYMYSKRAMAWDQIEVMRSLGFEKFAVVAH